MNEQDHLKTLTALRDDESAAMLTDAERESISFAISAIERSQWVAVEEKLPEVPELYAVTVPGSVRTEADYWNGSTWQRYRGHIAWMPLPEPYTPEESK